MEAVKSWRYKPYLLNGEPTEVDTTITVNFNLNGGLDLGAAARPSVPALSYAPFNRVWS